MDPRDNELEARLRGRCAPGGPPSACPKPLLLAAWLDGRAAEAEIELVETHLAECSTCLEAVRELRVIGDEIATAHRLVPARVRRAARALVTRPPRRTFRLAWPVVGRWSAAVAASLAVCAIGYRAGLVSFSAAERVSDELIVEMSFGTIDGRDPVDADLGLLALARPEGTR